jgi:predicted  nucleic acid-binding Zn-ribbon protein
MNPELERLIQLQKAESELKRLDDELAEVPRRSSALERELAGEQARLDEVRAGFEACQKARRHHEADLQDLEAKRSRHKEQLMEVKTNKEYTAKLHEIEGVERQISEREDQILEELERADTLAAALKEAESAFKEAEGRRRAAVAALQETEQALREARRRLVEERDGIAAGLDEHPLDLFRRVAKLRGGVAVAEARDGMCQVCHVVLRPQLFVDIKRNEEILQCQSCSRILYYEPPIPVADTPQP